MNSATFIGNLVAPAVQKQAQDRTFITFTVAVNRKYGQKEETLYVECIKSGDNAKLLPFLGKGTKVCVQGRVSCHAYIDKQNQAHANLDLAVFELELVGGKSDNQQGNQQQPQQQSVSNPFPTQQQQADNLPF